MEKILKSCAVYLTGTVFALFLASCSHPIGIVGYGKVLSESGDRDCYFYPFDLDKCKNYVVNDYMETYYASPFDGWQFHRWVNYCQNATDNQCSFNVPANIVNQFWGETAPPLIAVFTPIGADMPVVVDGKEWLQPSLFAGYTWEEISTVCPKGVCTGALPGSSINLTGYMWASVEDMNALFNHYLGLYPGLPLLGPGPDSIYLRGEIYQAFLDAGWLFHIIYWEGSGLGGFQFNDVANEPCIAEMVFVRRRETDNQLTTCYPSAEEGPWFYGAWFYRPL